MAITQGEFEELNERGYITVLSETVTLTHDQIRLGTAVSVVPAPGLGKIAIPVSAIVSASGMAAHPYGAIDADGYVRIGTNTPIDLLFPAVNDSGASYVDFRSLLEGQSVDGNQTDVFVVVSAPSQSSLAGWGVVGSAIAKVYVVNKAIEVQIKNGGATLTGGDAGNTLAVTVNYVVVSA